MHKALDQRRSEQRQKVQNFIDKLAVQKDVISSKKSELDKLNEEIRDKENLISEATLKDDLDAAEKLQMQVNEVELKIKTIHEEIEKLEDHQTVLENRMRKVKSQFVKELETIASKLNYLHQK